MDDDMEARAAELEARVDQLTNSVLGLSESLEIVLGHARLIARLGVGVSRDGAVTADAFFEMLDDANNLTQEVQTARAVALASTALPAGRA